MRSVLVVVALLFSTAVAHAAPPTTFTIHEGLDAQHVYVAWPRNCGADGSPLGNVSLALNPDWAARQHEVDYEVVEQGKRYEVSPFCVATMRIHVLPAAGFPTAMRTATADDLAIGHKPGETFPVLPALDAIDLAKRPAFFASDPRQRTLDFQFDTPKTDAWDLVLANDALSVRPTPPPTPSAAAAPEAATPAPTKDLGTRWVYAAAIGGLLAGGILARVQKKRRAGR